MEETEVLSSNWERIESGGTGVDGGENGDVPGSNWERIESRDVVGEVVDELVGGQQLGKN